MMRKRPGGLQTHPLNQPPSTEGAFVVIASVGVIARATRAATAAAAKLARSVRCTMAGKLARLSYVPATHSHKVMEPRWSGTQAQDKQCTSFWLLAQLVASST